MEILKLSSASKARLAPRVEPVPLAQLVRRVHQARLVQRVPSG